VRNQLLLCLRRDKPNHYKAAAQTKGRGHNKTEANMALNPDSYRNYYKPTRAEITAARKERVRLHIEKIEAINAELLIALKEIDSTFLNILNNRAYSKADKAVTARLHGTAINAIAKAEAI
jgi:hypothetical protein